MRSTPTDPTYGIHDARRMPEVDLILAILGRAIMDLFGSVHLAANPEEAAKARNEALVFLTRPGGAWARRRTELCDAVGIDGDDMRERVIRVLEGDTSALSAYDDMSQVERARKLWADEKAIPERAKNARERQSKVISMRRRAKVSKYADVRAAIMPVLDTPKTFKDLLHATDGDLSDTVMRDVLRNAITKGEIVQDPKTWEYSRVGPETAVAACAG